MQEIKCPKCGEVFQVDESGYAAIVKQVRDKEFSKEVQQEKEKYILVKHTLINEIHSLEDKVAEQILHDRFIQNIPMRMISGRYGYSSSTCYRLFCSALDTFADKYGKKWE